MQIPRQELLRGIFGIFHLGKDASGNRRQIVTGFWGDKGT